jgi:hypothetical protein
VRCRFCYGKGCFDCDTKSERACKDAFANPIYAGNPMEVPADAKRLGEVMDSILGADWENRMKYVDLSAGEKGPGIGAEILDKVKQARSDS